MVTYNFDTVIDRSCTDAVKIDRLDRIFGRHDVTPLWIADMDFAVCPEITEAIARRLRHPVLGYSEASESYWNSIIEWNRKRHGFSTKREEMTFIPGVVKGIAYAVNFFTEKGDGIVIQPPIYPPFRNVVQGNKRRVIENPLIPHPDGSYSMDLEGLEEIVKREKPRMLILCNPHNPIGIQWDRETLEKLAAICRKAGMIVVSDEIHGDLMLEKRKHIPFLGAGKDAEEIGVMLGAPSKTFNIPGLVSSWMVVKNPELREPFYGWLEANDFNGPALTATIGAEAAYRNGEQWLDQMLSYIESNIRYVEEFISSRLPMLKVSHPDASFLLWLDLRGLHCCQEQIMNLLLDKAHIALNDGTSFGTQGAGFVRLNVATPRSVLAHALENLHNAVMCIS